MMQASVALYMSYMYMDAYGLGAMSIGIEIMQPKHTNISTLSGSEWDGYGCSVPPTHRYHTPSRCIGILLEVLVYGIRCTP